MNLSKMQKKYSLREKISQMFILGFKNNDLSKINNAIKANLGGIIFFAENIETRVQTQDIISKFQQNAPIPLFISIDQEGGLVERTIRLEDKINYLPQMALANLDETDIKIHTEILTKELLSMGFNMNFAPVLDVNTNALNPIIGTRAFSQNTDEVIKNSKYVIDVLQKNGVISVGKHFPGHGEAFVDSHIDLPVIDLSIKNLEKNHIKPFEIAIKNGLDCLMAAHVNYKAFDENLPASLSENVIKKYLREKLNFQGLVISDDMVMGGITNHYKDLDACIMAIKAGVNIFIFRDLKMELINKIANIAQNDVELEAKINESFDKILFIKNKYSLSRSNNFNIDKDFIENSKKTLENISLKSLKIMNEEKFFSIKNKKTLILFPDRKNIYNYSFDKKSLKDFLPTADEIIYSLNPNEKEIKKIKNQINDYDA
ncbi:MAG: glycoside hydrolase family 3 N-terminal domain-containing protein, partial [Candidatus Gastranaerophilales bacterium]|nr:glycoside hydrolase family 3 N-terminal domain-containing protein [Candidatus Gastranaerophilales bacterium]